jgi:hypothetical protein
MARTPTRSSKMDGTLAIRVTDVDRANIKAAAMLEGTDMSHLVRRLLIEHKIIEPSGIQETII